MGEAESLAGDRNTSLVMDVLGTKLDLEDGNREQCIDRR